ncbi:MAG: hypothetical protein ABS873_08240, partial [Alkalibacterium sp.]
MKNSWIGWLLTLLLSVSLYPRSVHAQDNELIDMHVTVELLENGTAIITEQREMNLESGTENYIVINEEDGLDVLDFQVEGLNEEGDWDSDRSREEKAGTYGIIETRDGVELVWG